MRPTPITDRTLEKPWLLIAVYENAFAQYLELSDKLQRMYRKYGRKSLEKRMWIQAARSNELQDKIKKVSENLRNIDYLIHNYIVNHNKPVKQLKTA